MWGVAVTAHSLLPRESEGWMSYHHPSGGPGPMETAQTSFSLLALKRNNRVEQPPQRGPPPHLNPSTF